MLFVRVTGRILYIYLYCWVVRLYHNMCGRFVWIAMVPTFGNAIRGAHGRYIYTAVAIALLEIESVFSYVE